MAFDHEKFTQALKVLDKAIKEQHEAADELRTANSNLCGASNRLNEAQRKFDAVVSEFKKEAPNGSDWAAQR